MGMVLSGAFSNGQDIHSQQNISTKSTIIEKNDLKILSWNIKMMPAPYGWFHNSVERAENIIQALKSSETYDVILFQEAFSRKIRKIIFDGLQSIYPYQILPKNQPKIFKTNSGLKIFDLGSAIDLNHPKMMDFLKRDINNISNFFVKRGLTVENPVDVLARITK